MVNSEQLFWKLWNCKNEREVEEVFRSLPELNSPDNWRLLGEQEGNQAVVENQQATPAAALVEKIVNSIDAVLMRKCRESGMDPESPSSPRSIDQAIQRFFPEHNNWEFETERVAQARDIQILTDVAKNSMRDTSIVIYDAGEGQHPKAFESTFCSLLSENKNRIHFVQGRFNMGGSGALPFCGTKHFQLIGSRRFDGGDFGFTLIREHPLSEAEALDRKNTWYEYLVLDGQVPHFAVSELDLGLYRRRFSTGTVIKLYSYDTRNNSDLRRNMGRSLNELLFKPALPYFLVERRQRIRSTHETGAGTAFGLSFRLSHSEHIDESFSKVIDDDRIGHVKVTVHVFKSRIGSRDKMETTRFIRQEFFRNNMVVLFTLNGQVHGHLDRRFITNSLEFNLLKNHLLIHVDCSNVKPTFRKRLFMSSRDRMRHSEETHYLQDKLKGVLLDGKLKEIYKRRKDDFQSRSKDSEEMLKEIMESLTIDDDLRKFLGRALKLDSRAVRRPRKQKPVHKRTQFQSKRYPSFLTLKTTGTNKTDLIEIPRNGEKTLRFDSDVANDYFDRSKDPGELQLGVMTWRQNDNTGGDKQGTANEISEIISVTRHSPQDGTIRVVLQPNKVLRVGDTVKICAKFLDSANPNGVPPRLFWVRISDPKKTSHSDSQVREDLPSLPRLTLVYEKTDDQSVTTWENVPECEMDHNTVMHPFVEGTVIERIYINMDSRVFKSYRSTLRSDEDIEKAQLKYVAAVYCHALFLYTVSRQRGYESVIQLESAESEKSFELTEYLKDIFASHYASFLLDYSSNEMMNGLAS